MLCVLTCLGMVRGLYLHVHTCAGSSLLGMSPRGELYGELPATGVGEAKPVEKLPVWDALYGNCVESNTELLNSLRTDENEAALHALAVEDARLGRMSTPLPARDMDLSEARLVPRFSVVQGDKLRAVDNLSWSAKADGPRKRKRADIKAASLNGHCTIPECIEHSALYIYTVRCRGTFVSIENQQK